MVTAKYLKGKLEDNHEKTGRGGVMFYLSCSQDKLSGGWSPQRAVLRESPNRLINSMEQILIGIYRSDYEYEIKNEYDFT